MNRQVVISIITGIFIYFRTLDYYQTMPRKNMTVAALIALWTYMSIQNPIFIIAGLLALNIFGHKHLSI